LKCESCIRAILDTPSVHDHTYYKEGDDNKSIKKFTFVKQRSGLKLASDSVCQTIRLTENVFKSLMIDKKKLFAKNMDQKIIIYVHNKLATSSTLFRECNDLLGCNRLIFKTS